MSFHPTPVCTPCTRTSEDDDESIVVKKVRRDSSSRRNCEADYAPTFDSWGTQQNGERVVITLAMSQWYILSLVVRRKMKF